MFLLFTKKRAIVLLRRSKQSKGKSMIDTLVKIQDNNHVKSVMFPFQTNLKRNELIAEDEDDRFESYVRVCFGELDSKLPLTKQMTAFKSIAWDKTSFKHREITALEKVIVESGEQILVMRNVLMFFYKNQYGSFVELEALVKDTKNTYEKVSD